jgi:hypothetical protein
VGVPVRVVPGGRSARTNTKGKFTLPVPGPGHYRVTATLAGTSASARVGASASGKR